MEGAGQAGAAGVTSCFVALCLTVEAGVLSCAAVGWCWCEGVLV